MEKIETLNDFKQFLNEHRDLIKKKAVKVSELPEDDEWIKDNKWDEIYECDIKKSESYKWMSFDEMENNDEIMTKNEEIVAFVKTNI